LRVADEEQTTPEVPGQGGKEQRNGPSKIAKINANSSGKKRSRDSCTIPRNAPQAHKLKKRKILSTCQILPISKP
jgi:hypothetical protein